MGSAMCRFWQQVRIAFLVPVLVGLTAAGTWAAVVKLFLKDGSWQLVKSYEVRGDRVRYYSVERSAWEEIPLSLVDFEATQRAQEQEKAAQKEVLDEAREISRQRIERPEEAGWEIAPGVRLPAEEGIFTYDGLRVIRLFQSSAEVITDKKRALLVLALPGPLIKNRAFVVLPGPKAAVRITMEQPTFCVQLEGGQDASLELVPLKSRKESRYVEKLEWRGAGQPVEIRSALPVERTQIAPGLFTLKPAQPLPPGEYALAELIQQKLNLNLWDFGVDKPRPRPNLSGQ